MLKAQTYSPPRFVPGIRILVSRTANRIEPMDFTPNTGPGGTVSPATIRGLRWKVLEDGSSRAAEHRSYGWEYLVQSDWPQSRLFDGWVYEQTLIDAGYIPGDSS